MILYLWLLRLLAPLVLVRLAWRGLRNRGYWHRWGERFGFVPFRVAGPVIWLHAVSVGETRAAAPLVRALQAHVPGHALFVTTTTPTGSAQVEALFGDSVLHSYFPYDLPSAVRRFLGRVRPKMLIVMETELWPFLFQECRARRIPLAVVNVRMSESALRRYQRFPALTRVTLEQVNLFAVQTDADARRLRALGAPDAAIQVTGSIKFDIELPADLEARAQALRAQWGGKRPIWIAASTHEGEEEQVLRAFGSLKERLPNLLLVLVPRHPERFGAVARLAGRSLQIALRSEQRGALAPETEVLVGDTMGELQLLLAASDVAFIGGSLVPVGGHNLLEAAAVGVPAIFGPHMFNFAEIARLTRERSAGREVADAQALVDAVQDYLTDTRKRQDAGGAGRRLVAENRGALARTVALLVPLIPG